MKHVKRLPLLAVLLCVPLLIASSVGPPPRIRVGPAQWTPSSESIEIPLAVHSQFVRKDGYFVWLGITIVDSDGAVVARIVHWEPVVVTGPITKDRDSLVEIEPAFVRWDRNDGAFSGPAVVCLMAQVFDPKGRRVRHVEAETCSEVEIR